MTSQKVVRRSAKGLPPVNWGLLAERYAAEPSLTLDALARETGRSLSTLRTHARRRRWMDLRRKVQAKTAESLRAKLQQEQERFALTRQRRMLRIADRATRALLANLAAPAGEHGFGSDKVDGYQLQAILKAFDDGTLAGKVAQTITPILFEAMDRAAIEQLMAERRASVLPRATPSHGTNGTTDSIQRPPSVDGRVASLFSRRNGSS